METFIQRVKRILTHVEPRSRPMQDQHNLIVGYRDLTQMEIDAINECKLLSGQVGALVADLRGVNTYDQRWVSIGATELQLGFMSLNRSIAQPTTF